MSSMPSFSNEINVQAGLPRLRTELSNKILQRREFYLNLMVVGKSGLGKSTFLNTLFSADIYQTPVERTNSVKTRSVLLKEDDVSLFLTIADTPGFGDAVDNTHCIEPIIEYIEANNELYFKSELGLAEIAGDPRVHCCLYFIQPTGHDLNQLDIAFLRQLGRKVKVIPVIAKADTLMLEERASFKRNILDDIARNDIKIYQFPDDAETNSMSNKMPFTVIGANSSAVVNGKTVRTRKYSWGTVEIENIEHCDFIALKTLLLHKYMQDLIKATDRDCYSAYKQGRLQNFVIQEIKNKTTDTDDAANNNLKLTQTAEEKFLEDVVELII